jgi:hypothetical protein
MKNQSPRRMADAMTAARFAAPYCVKTWDDLCDRLDRRTTAHLNGHLRMQVIGTTGTQRRRITFTIEDGATLIAAIPMNDPRTGTEVWAKIEFGDLLDVLRSGADGAWKMDHKGSDQRGGQVRTKVPLQGRASASNVAVARIILKAQKGQQARRHDGDPLNLRRPNLYLKGSPGTAEGKAGTAKTDTRAMLRDHAVILASLAGQDYGPAPEC